MPTEKPDDSPTINPQLLRQPSWLLHRNKKPYYTSGRPRSGTLDSPTDLRKLAAYDDALAALAGGKYTGLGIAINQGLQFVDLDKCRDAVTTHVAAWVPDLLRRAIEMGAFVEVSISGTGFHIVGFGPSIRTFKGKHIEVYDHGRYMALGTEVISSGTDPLPDLSPLLAEFTPEHAPKPPPKPKLRLVGGSPMLWPGDKQDALKALKRLNPDIEYPDWIKVGMALHKASGGNAEGLEVWESWSANGEKHKDGECARMWAGFKPDGAVGMGTLMHMAQEVEEPPPKAKPKARAKPVSAPVDTDASPFKLTRVSDLRKKTFDPVVFMTRGQIEMSAGAYILAGKPKHGKTWMAMGLSMAIGTGQEYLGTRPVNVGEVAYLACDDSSERRFHDRMNLVSEADMAVALVTEWNPTAESTIDVLNQMADSLPDLKMVVIDTLSAFRKQQRTENPYQQEYDEVKALNDWAHTRGIVVLIVHHLRKGAVDPQDPFESISGTLGLQGAVDGLLVLSRTDDKDDAGDSARKLAGLWMRARDMDRELSLGIELKDGRWHVIGTPQDVFHAGTQRMILQVLREANGRWLTSKEIHAAGDFDCKAASVQKSASRMAARGLIEAHRGALQGNFGAGGGYRLLPGA